MWAECVLVSLSDWTHVFHRGDESVPFAPNICRLVSRWDDLRDMAWGERLSPLCTHSLVMWSHACVEICAYKCMLLKGERPKLLSLGVHVSVQTYGLTGMQTLRRSARRDQCPGSKCQTQLTGPLHFHHVTLQMSRRRLPFVLNTYMKTVGSPGCQVVANSFHSRRKAHWLSLVFKNETAAGEMITSTVAFCLIEFGGKCT